eukprot:TRINITY_DN40333_c0_g1_i1.p1 TRINITY_DN40333_c0_g1~~TRINITY_DN40333_c0_g1_i1.p1  ORF type:complete len:434 (-),score=56.32 TRINITY_DN40333_c0_g1_i1:185-1393(-)
MTQRPFPKRTLTPSLTLPARCSSSSFAPPRLDIARILSCNSSGGRLARENGASHSHSPNGSPVSNSGSPSPIGRPQSCWSPSSPSNKNQQRPCSRGSKMDAEGNLRSAMGMRETGGLRLAIEFAKNDGVDGQLVAEAQHQLAQLEAQMMLALAIRSKDCAKLMDAMEKAAKAGVSKQLRQQAALQFAQIKAFVNGGTCTPSPGHGEVLEQLHRAIAMRETGALRLAIRLAEDYVDEDETVRKATKDAQHVLSVAECEWLLAIAVRSNDKSKLQEAIGKVELLNLERPPATVEQAKMLLLQISAREDLSSAMLSKDVRELSSALEKAKLHGVEKSKLDRAGLLLAQAAAREDLFATMPQPPSDVDLLSRCKSMAPLRGDRRIVKRTESLVRLPRQIRRVQSFS